MGKRETAAKLGRYIAASRDTVRGAAARFGLPKSTVHNLVTKTLPRYDAALAAEVAAVLRQNLAVRHIRGGEATRKKFGREK